MTYHLMHPLTSTSCRRHMPITFNDSWNRRIITVLLEAGRMRTSALVPAHFTSFSCRSISPVIGWVCKWQQSSCNREKSAHFHIVFLPNYSVFAALLPMIRENWNSPPGIRALIFLCVSRFAFVAEAASCYSCSSILFLLSLCRCETRNEADSNFWIIAWPHVCYDRHKSRHKP